MSDDALNAAPEAVQTDTLTEQAADPRPLDVKPQVEEKPESRSETVRKAIEKVTGEKAEAEKLKAEKPEPKPEAKTEKPADKSVEKPAEKPAEQSTRGEDGKFTKREQDDRPEPRPSAFKEAPGRFDDAAKSEWEGVPESVRGATHRAIREAEEGVKKYKADAEAYEAVRQYDEMAKSHGNSLAGVLEEVANIEDAFARSPIEGMHRIAQRMGFDIRQLAQAIVAQSPQQVASQQTQMQMADLQRQKQEFERQLQAEREARQIEGQRTEALTEWQRFQQENPAAANMEAEIAEFLTKYPARDDVPMRDRLEDAFAFASAKTNGAHTAPAVAQTQPAREPNPAGRKSVAGVSREGATRPKETLSRGDAIKKAMRAHGLA